MSNAWARLFPFGEYAFRVSVMVAVCGALSVALIYLVVFEAVRGGGLAPARGGGWFATGAALAAALVSGFSFTAWHNANEAEVYTVSSLIVAATLWLAMQWRSRRGSSNATQYLVLAMYLAALSVGNHLLGLLVGPGLIVFVWHQLRHHPHDHDAVRRAEAGQLWVIASVWLLLVGVGLGSTAVLSLAGLLVLVALVLASQRGAMRFGLAALAVCLVGLSTYAFLYIRAGFGPTINMGDPSSWEALTALISRKQYPPRLPWDNPLYLSGANNPGRPLDIIWLQILNYLQYFDWQWSKGLATARTLFAWPRLPLTILFTYLGMLGASVLRKRDAATFWLLLFVFLVTGPGLVGYMNFKPGFSLAYDQFPTFAQHEVRERDYFFLLSFQTWGVWAGIGIAAVCRYLLAWLRSHSVYTVARRMAAAAVYGAAALPFVLNHAAAVRNRDPEAHLAVDFAYDVLQSIEPYGILITGGDNDTYPLWYAQEVLGVRPDVTVVVASLSNLDWFVRGLRDRPVRPFDPGQAPWFAAYAPAEVPPPLHSLTDEQIAALTPVALPQPLRYRAGVIDRTFAAGTPLYIQDQVALRLIQENVGRRPVYFALSAGSDSWAGLGDSLVQEGLTYRLYADRSPLPEQLGAGLNGIPVNIERTDTLASEVYRYAGLFDADTSKLGPTEQGIVAAFGTMFYALGVAFDSIGNRTRALESVERGYHLMPRDELRPTIESMRGSLRGAAETEAVP
jgi:hypothetical protein